MPNIEFLIGGNGEIAIGRIGPAHCAATACTEHKTLAMLVRHDDETLEKLMIRLDVAIEKEVGEEIFTDEINNDPDEGI